MKKIVLFLLVTSLVFTSLMAVPVMAEDLDIGTVYVDQNFDDATLGFDIYDNVTYPSGSYQPVNVLNNATGLNMPWKTFIRDWDATNLYFKGYTKITNIGTNPDESINNALVSGRKAQIPFYLNIDTDVDGVLTPSPVEEAGKLIYTDIRVKRVSLSDDIVTFYMLDSSGREIYTIEYNSGKYPILKSSVVYGGELAAGVPTVTYPYTDQWLYLRSVIDFETKTFQLFHGETLDSLTPMVDGVVSFTFKNTAATNLYTIKSATKGGLGFDDLKIYSVTPSSITKPVASGITIEGKPNIGATLTATYGTYTDTTPEGNSYGYWEASDNALFAGPVKISADIPITAGGTNDFVITEAEKGKYLRFTVVPINEDASVGDPASSNPTAYPAGIITYNLRTTGPTKWDTEFDFKYATNSYPGVVDIMNSSDEPVNAILISAWYKDGVVTEVYTTPIDLAAGSSDETGVISATITTTAKDIPSGTSSTGLVFKIFLWDGLSTLKPLYTPAVFESAS